MCKQVRVAIVVKMGRQIEQLKRVVELCSRMESTKVHFHMGGTDGLWMSTSKTLSYN